MAPELLRGARLARPASDIFSFGIIAYELFTGRLPSETPPMLLPLKPLARWYPALSVRCPDLPEFIGGLIERCLDAAPENRPPAAELAAAIRKWLEKSPSAAG
jgi:serine/threonine-protein kinase